MDAGIIVPAISTSFKIMEADSNLPYVYSGYCLDLCGFNACLNACSSSKTQVWAAVGPSGTGTMAIINMYNGMSLYAGSSGAPPASQLTVTNILPGSLPTTQLWKWLTNGTISPVSYPSTELNVYGGFPTAQSDYGGTTVIFPILLKLWSIGAGSIWTSQFVAGMLLTISFVFTVILKCWVLASLASGLCSCTGM